MVEFRMLIDCSIDRLTGFASAKVGRWAAFTIGGAIILLEIANEQGIIKVDWYRLNQKADKISDKVQEAVTGEGPKWMDKVRDCNFTFLFILGMFSICISRLKFLHTLSLFRQTLLHLRISPKTETLTTKP